MSHSTTPQSLSLIAGIDSPLAGIPAADQTGLRISQHDQWTMPEATMALFSYVCLADSIGAQAV